MINGILPLSQPYSASPYLYPGLEAVSSMPADVVDWVLVMLRDTMTETTIARRAALLLSDGALPIAAFAIGEGEYLLATVTGQRVTEKAVDVGDECVVVAEHFRNRSVP